MAFQKQFKKSAVAPAITVTKNNSTPVAPAAAPDPILTGEQVAERLQLKPSTIYELTRRRNRRPLPALRAGKFLRFRWSEIDRWLNESREAA